MQANILDFKQPLESKLTKISNKDFKTNNFSKEMDRANKNSNSVEKQPDKDKDYINSGDTEKIEKNGNKEKKLVKEAKKDDEIQYEGMIGFFNIKEIEEDTKLESRELNKTIFIVDENLESENKLALEENHELSNLKVNEKNPEKTEEINSKKLVTENFIKLDDKETKPELLSDNVDRKEITVKANEFEELSVGEEENILNVKENFSDNREDGLQGENQKGETDSNETYELVRSSLNEENVEVSNESFGPIVKNGLEFPTDKLIDSEIPQVEPKEVIKQIVDQVKFDLSENKNEMKLTLKPEALGEMTMNIEVTKDGIIAKIMVDNYNTKEIIESNVFQLKEGIKDTGMEIKTFEVFVGNGSDFDQHNSNQFNFNQNNKKLKIKNNNNKFIIGYEDGTISDNINLANNNLEGGLNLLA